MKANHLHLKLTCLVCASILTIGCGDSSGPSAPSLGEIEVTVVTSGDQIDIDSDGYYVQLDYAFLGKVDANGKLAIHALAPGIHSVQLSGLAGNCFLTGTAVRWVTVDQVSAVPITFDVSCVKSSGEGGWDY